MKKKDFLFNFLMFSMLILIILIVMLIFKEYENKYEISKSQYNKKYNVESSLVQSDSKNVKKQEVQRKLNNQATQKKEEREKVVKQTTDEITQVNPKELIVNSAEYDKNFVNAVIMQLNYIPSDILNDFNNQGWKIYIGSEEEIYSKLGKHESMLSSKDEGQFLKGYTEIKDKTIYITYHSMALRDNTIIHEIGHYYDIKNAWASCTEEYRSIYEKEKNSLNRNTQINSNLELFAETFECIILEEEGYEELETYQYVKDIIYHN